MKSFKIAVLPGDGIGEEVTDCAIRVLSATAKRFSFKFEVANGLIGGAAFDVFGNHFPVETQELIGKCDAVVFGSVGGPISEQLQNKWKNCEANSILALRKACGCNINLRPVRVYPELAGLSPLRADKLGTGIDMVIVRELLGDIYFGAHATGVENGRRKASDVAEYTEDQISVVARAGFELAKTRKCKVTSVDKANVLDTSKLWRTVVGEVAKEYPEVRYENMLVDNCAMQLVVNPSQFDVVVTANLFGDILSDVAAVLPGSLGLLPSASLSATGFGLYEPSGGSAPDIAGRGVANPIGQILSVAMMLRISFGLTAAADGIERAVAKTLAAGHRTADLSGGKGNVMGSREFTDQIITRISD